MAAARWAGPVTRFRQSPVSHILLVLAVSIAAVDRETDDASGCYGQRRIRIIFVFVFEFAGETNIRIREY